MLVESVGASMLVGKLRKGKLLNLSDEYIEKWYMLPSAVTVEFFTVYMATKGHKLFIDNILVIHFISYMFMFYCLYFNTHKKYFKIITLGILLNFTVIILNNGQMPVSSYAMTKIGKLVHLESIRNGMIITHSLINENTILPFLGDVLYIGRPYPLAKAFSIGDILLAGGVFAYIQKSMTKK